MIFNQVFIDSFFFFFYISFNFMKEEVIFMTKKNLSVITALIVVMMLSSCKTMSVSMTETKSIGIAPIEVTLDDFELGEIVTFEMEVTRRNKRMYKYIRRHPERFQQYIIAELLKEHPGYDVLLFPRFQSSFHSFGKVKERIYLSGRLAKVINKNGN